MGKNFAQVLNDLLDPVNDYVTKKLVSYPLKKRFKLFEDALDRLCKTHDVRLMTIDHSAIVIDGSQHNHDTDELLYDPVYQVELGKLTKAGYTGGDNDS